MSPPELGLRIRRTLSSTENAIMTSDGDEEMVEECKSYSGQPSDTKNTRKSNQETGENFGGEFDHGEEVPQTVKEHLRAFMVWGIGYIIDQTTEFIKSAHSFSVSFLGLHYFFIIGSSLVMSIIFYPMKNMTYTDALFNAVSMATCTGLNATNGNDMKLYQTITIFIMVSLSQPLFIHSGLIWFRLSMYERKFDNINEKARQQSKLRRAATRIAAATARTGVGGDDSGIRRSATVGSKGYQGAQSHNVTATAIQPDAVASAEPTGSSFKDHGLEEGSVTGNNYSGVAFGELPRPSNKLGVHERSRDVYRSLNMLQNKKYIVEDNEEDDDDEGPALIIKSPQAIEADAARGIESSVFIRDSGGITFQNAPKPSHATHNGDDGTTSGAFSRHDTMRSILSQRSRQSSRPRRLSMSANYLSWQPTVGGNSIFVNLTQDQKDELGGVEYRALRVLLYFIYGYHFSMILLAGVIFAIWCASRSHYADIIRSEGNDPVWFGFFTGMSSFNNLGFSLSPNSLADFQQTAFIPLFAAFFILFGDMLLPVGLRLSLWITFRLTPRYGVLHESLGFLLDHPRRCFSLLFPGRATWWLLIIVLALALTDFVLFVILDINNQMLASIPVNYRVMCGFFQGLSVRKCGFGILTMTSLHPAILVVYLVMIYISVLPVAISMRSTNVYEEQSLGVYYYPEEYDQLPKGGEQSTLSKHLQRQLAHDLWYISLGMILLAICEGGPLQRGEISLFDILFECVSGYGNSGASLGWPSTSLSLSGKFNTIGKLVMMGLMIRGRHRGLPYPVERAILLKDEDLKSRDQAQQNVVRDAQLLQMSRTIPDPENPWLARIGTAASRIRRETTTKLDRAMAARPPIFRHQTIQGDHPAVSTPARNYSELSSSSSDVKDAEDRRKSRKNLKRANTFAV